MPSENFESVLWDVSSDVNDEPTLDTAVSKLTYENDRQIVKTAIRLVHQTYPDWFTSG